MWTEEKLNQVLAEPSEALVADMGRIQGDILVLGAGGKMGPSLCLLAKNAVDRAGVQKRIIAVSRFTDAQSAELLTSHGIEIIPCDLQDPAQLNALPLVENVLYMAGRKFGTDGNEWQTWGMNATLPAMVAEKYKASNIVVFSSGNIYPLCPMGEMGYTEAQRPGPIGEYAMSCLARERAFEYAANHYGTKVLMYRLSFAVDLRYGVLFDIANAVLNEKPISVRTPAFNCIWQGTANEIAIRSLLHTGSPSVPLNVTGPEFGSVRKIAKRFGKIFGKEPIYTGEEQRDAYLSDAGKSFTLFGYPTVTLDTLIEWQASWLMGGGRTLDKPTHFEERGGVY